MKKILALIFCVSVLMGITACDSTTPQKIDNSSLLLGASMVTGPITSSLWNIPEIVDLSGSTWRYVGYTLIQKDVQNAATNQTVTRTFIPLRTQTINLTFNADFTFTAAYTNVYHANISNNYQSVATFPSTTYSGYPGGDSFGKTGYAGNPVLGGTSTVNLTGVWRKAMEYDATNDQMRPVYYVKLLTTSTITYSTSGEVSPSTYGTVLTNTATVNQTAFDLDSNWMTLFTPGYIDGYATSNGVEANFQFDVVITSFIAGASQIYTRQ